MPFAAVSGITLHFTLNGVREGLPLIFINALGSDLRIWDGVLPHFAENFPIIRYDKRGHGLSDCPPAPYSIRNHVDDLAGLLTYLKVEAAILIGISVGGMIAMAYAAQYPERIRGLVLCDTGLTIGTAEMWNERIESVRQKGMSNLGEALVARWFTPAFAEQHPAEYRGYYNMLTRTPVIGYTATCEALRDADLNEAARTIKTKTLVLCGSGDIATPPDVGRTLAQTLADARFGLIEKAGHLPCIEQSDILATSIKHFLRELGYV